MSEFSEKLNLEIKKTKKPLHYLAEACGIQLDYISKMRRGKRIPQDETWIEKLAEAMECTSETRRELLRLYRQEKMGKIQWECMEELIGIVEQEPTESSLKTDEVSAGSESLERSVLSSESEVLFYFYKILSENHEKISIWTAEADKIVYERLAQMFCRIAGSVEHLFPLNQNQDDEDTLNNLQIVRILKPAMSHEGYQPYFYYWRNPGERNAGLLPNWFLTEKLALGFNRLMNKGILIDDAEQISMMITEFQKKKQEARSLIFRLGIQEYLGRVNQMMNSGYVACNYYIEQSPCLLQLIPMDVLQKQIVLGGGAERKALFDAIRLRVSCMEKEEMVHIFSTEGLQYLMKEGKIAGYPEQLYRPFSMAMRRWLLKRYYQYIQSSSHSCICVREDRIRLPRNISIVSSSNVENGIAFGQSSKNGFEFILLKEPGISRKLCEFCEFLKDGNLTYSSEETLEMIKKMVEQYEDR